ncbi:hypothetical protein ACWDZ4_31175 [Streptomyces sp. NPDC003016]
MNDHTNPDTVTLIVLALEGMPVDFSGCPYGRPFAYHRLDSIGVRIELVDISRQVGFLNRWHPGGEPMPAIDEISRG